MIALSEPTTAAEVIANIKAVRARLGLSPKQRPRIVAVKKVSEPAKKAEPEPKAQPQPEHTLEEVVAMEPSPLPEVSILTAQIKLAVAKHYGISVHVLRSRARDARTVRCRQVTMYLIRTRLTSLSLPQIGRAFGGFDHTTVLNAVRQVERKKDLDPSLSADIEQITKQLEA